MPETVVGTVPELVTAAITAIQARTIADNRAAG
jgi:hypothetical protein